MKAKPQSLFGIALILVAIICNEYLLAQAFSSDGVLDIASRLFIWIIQVGFLSLGLLFILARHSSTIHRALFVCLSSGLIIYTIALGIEVTIGLLHRPHEQHIRYAPSDHVYFEKYETPYEPFVIQHLHPLYFFFLPWKPDQIDQANNEIVSVDRNGFRGASPDERGDRKLAFILGGSTVFGHGSSGNDTTVTGFLNRIQDTFLFINAGVPSWNSTQELIRSVMQISNYKPDLVIALDGMNDANISFGRRNQPAYYPTQTPSSYRHLERWVDDIRLERVKPPKENIWALAFEALKLASFRIWVNDLLSQRPESHGKPTNNGTGPTVNLFTELSSHDRNFAKRAADNYIDNLESIKNYLGLKGTRFIGIFQPYLYFHEKVPEEVIYDAYTYQTRYVDQFKRRAMEQAKSRIEYIDFGNLFDSHFEQTIPMGDIFLDRLHLFDDGCEIVAKEIKQILIKNGLISE